VTINPEFTTSTKYFPIVEWVWRMPISAANKRYLNKCVFAQILVNMINRYHVHQLF
jgi:hypothetical protein